MLPFISVIIIIVVAVVGERVWTFLNIRLFALSFTGRRTDFALTEEKLNNVAMHGHWRNAVVNMAEIMAKNWSRWWLNNFFPFSTHLLSLNQFMYKMVVHLESSRVLEMVILLTANAFNLIMFVFLFSNNINTKNIENSFFDAHCLHSHPRTLTWLNLICLLIHGQRVLFLFYFASIEILDTQIKIVSVRSLQTSSSNILLLCKL